MSTWPINQFLWLYRKARYSSSKVCLGTGLWGKLMLKMLITYGVDDIFAILEVKPPETHVQYEKKLEITTDAPFVFGNQKSLAFECLKYIDDFPNSTAEAVLNKILPGSMFNYSEYTKALLRLKNCEVYEFKAVEELLGFIGCPKAIKKKHLKDATYFSKNNTEVSHHNVFVADWANPLGTIQTVSNAGVPFSPMEESGVVGLDFLELELKEWDTIINDLYTLEDDEIDNEILECLTLLHKQHPAYINNLLFGINEYKRTHHNLDQYFGSGGLSSVEDLGTFFKIICKMRPFDNYILLTCLRVNEYQRNRSDELIKLVPSCNFSLV